jgi:hypothetical protein
MSPYQAIHVPQWHSTAATSISELKQSYSLDIAGVMAEGKWQWG